MRRHRVVTFFTLLSLIAALSACLASPGTSANLEIEIQVDGEIINVEMPGGSTVFDALETSGIDLGSNDQVDPPNFAILTNGSSITVVRVVETVEVETEVVPFLRQILPNEALPEGDTRLVQAGVMGLEEVTYRIRQEGGKDPIKIAINRILVEDPVPEILMVGVQSSFVPVTFSGRIAYASAGNAWLIEGETGNRNPLVLSGDLDGRIFQLSPDGRWLLFTRASADENSINSLWIVKTTSTLPEPIDLKVENIIHFSAWAPNSSNEQETYTIGYSTVEPRSSAPGWQANNDFLLLELDETGVIVDEQSFIEPNPGGQYGWWGTSYSWSPTGERLAFARADSIGLLDLDQGSLNPLVEITPFQTFGDWAWVCRNYTFSNFRGLGLGATNRMEFRRENPFLYRSRKPTLPRKSRSLPGF
jgi:hypothetical protein